MVALFGAAAPTLASDILIGPGIIATDTVELDDGQTLDNAGRIEPSTGAGVSASDTGTIINRTGGTISSADDSGIYLGIGGTVTNEAGAIIKGSDGIYGDWLSPGTMTVTNSGTIVGTIINGVDLENGGTLTNQDGGFITGVDNGVLAWGGTITNTGSGSRIEGTNTGNGAGINLADRGDIINEDGASVVGGYDGVRVYIGGSVTNRSGAAITGNTFTGVFGDDGTVDVTNTGTGSLIEGNYIGVQLDDGGSITNEDGAEIRTGGVDGGAAIVLYGGVATITNGANSTIRGRNDDAHLIRGIYRGSYYSTTLNNAGTIIGDVRLGDSVDNHVTLYSGSVIDGDLYASTSGGTGSTLTLTGTGTQLYSDAVTGETTFIAGVLTKSGSGTWIIDSAINQFTAAIAPTNTVITAGTLQIGNGNSGNTAGRLSGNIANSGTLAFNRSDNITYSDVVSGTGNLVKLGAGRLTLTGTNSYAGGTTISAGTLQVGNGGTTGTIVGDVGNNGTLAFNRSNTLSFSGTISGSGSVSKLGAGTLTLSGANIYSGGTTISAGTLIGSATSFGTGGIVNNGTLIIDQATDTVWANTLSGTGTVIKRGTGSLKVTTGGGGITAATVEAGRLAIDSLMSQAVVTVKSGGKLGGTGTVGGIVAETGSVVSPGNSIGVMTVTGNYTPAAGSTYEVELTGSGQSGRIAATGSATIAAGALLDVVRYDATPYAIGTRYTVLTTTTGRSGTFTLTGDLNPAGFLVIDDEYDADNAYLVVNQSRALASAALTSNQSAVAAALDAAGSGVPASNAALNAADAAAARVAFDALSGEVHSSLRTALLLGTGAARDAALDQPQGDDSPFWARTEAGAGRIAGDGNAGEALNTTGGFLFGSDLPVAEHLRLGVMAGIVGTNSAKRGAHAAISSYTLGLYGAADFGNLAFRFGATGSLDDIGTTTRVALPGIAAAKTGYWGATGQIFAEAAYGLDAGPLHIEPFAGLALAGLATTGFSETATGLSGQAGTAHLATSTIGVRVSSTVELADADLSLDAEFGWRHVLSGSAAIFTGAYGGASYTVVGAPLPADTLELGLGGTLSAGDSAELGLRYTGSLGANATSHALTGSLKVRF